MIFRIEDKYRISLRNGGFLLTFTLLVAHVPAVAQNREYVLGSRDDSQNSIALITKMECVAFIDNEVKHGTAIKNGLLELEVGFNEKKEPSCPMPEFNLRGRKTQEKAVAYGLKRLRDFYLASQKKNEGQRKTQAFCENYEAIQRRDKEFFQLDRKSKRPLPFENSDPQRWKAAREAGLTDAEVVALHSYTTFTYQQINRSIRDATAKINPVPLSQEYMSYVNLINSALDRLPIFKER